jgi:hypothetical protein
MERTQRGLGPSAEREDMMQGIPLKCWEEFEEASLRMISDTTRIREREVEYVHHPLFRGVRDSTEPLQSSLDKLGKATTLSGYYHTIKVVHEHVETCTGKKWDLATKVHFGGFDLQAYEFMAYLRQNGFPSPLLDWTKSPYVAAFFAFRDIYHKPVNNEYVSIFVFREHCGKGKFVVPEKPNIYTLGPSIATCRSHYLQQSEYSICVREDGPEVFFANHEDVGEREGGEQDLLIKFNIPMSEQVKVLTRLDSMNVTPYSLFDSESSLMDTLAIRELVIGA